MHDMIHMWFTWNHQQQQQHDVGWKLRKWATTTLMTDDDDDYWTHNEWEDELETLSDLYLELCLLFDPRITVLQGKVLVHSSWWQGMSNTISTWKITIYLKCKIPRAGQLLNHFTWTSKCGSVIWINNIKKNSIYALICLRKIVFLSQDKHSLTILNSSSK